MKKPTLNQAAYLMMLALGLLTVALFCGGCEAFKETERTYSVAYDADNKSGSVSMTFRPASPRSTAPAPVWGMDDATIERIVKIVEASARRNAATLPDLTLPVGEISATEGLAK